MGAGSPAPAGLWRRLLTEQGQSHRGGGAGPGGSGGWSGGAGLALARQLSHQRRGAPATQVGRGAVRAPRGTGGRCHLLPWGGAGRPQPAAEGRAGQSLGWGGRRSGTRGSGRKLPPPAPPPALTLRPAASGSHLAPPHDPPSSRCSRRDGSHGNAASPPPAGAQREAPSPHAGRPAGLPRPREGAAALAPIPSHVRGTGRARLVLRAPAGTVPDDISPLRRFSVETSLGVPGCPPGSDPAGSACASSALAGLCLPGAGEEPAVL